MSAPMNSLPRSFALWVILPLLCLGRSSISGQGAGAGQLLKKSKVQSTANEPEVSAAPAASPYLDLGPLLGHISSSHALVWVKGSGPARLALPVAHTSALSD